MVEQGNHYPTYREHLFDKRWRTKREGIIHRDGCRCSICGAEDKLVVHHKQYHITAEGKKLLPWMYDDKYLITLCETCHKRGHAKYKVPVIVIE